MDARSVGFEALDGPSKSGADTIPNINITAEQAGLADAALM